MEPISAGTLLTAGAVGLGQGLTNIASGMIGGSMSRSTARKVQAHEHRWQEKMRATAYQTAVDDLEKAGLNPALAYMNGSASAGVGGGTASAPAPDTNARMDIMDIISSAKELEKIDAETKNINADTKNKEQTYILTPDLVKSTIALNNANTGKAYTEAEKNTTEIYTEKLRQYKLNLENQMGDMDIAKRKAFYKEEMEAYVLNMKREIAKAGLESNQVYQAIDHAFETVGKVWGSSTNTSTSTSTHAGKSQVNINKN